jgi:hypothetical protein
MTCDIGHPFRPRQGDPPQPRPPLFVDLCLPPNPAVDATARESRRRRVPTSRRCSPALATRGASRLTSSSTKATCLCSTTGSCSSVGKGEGEGGERELRVGSLHTRILHFLLHSCFYVWRCCTHSASRVSLPSSYLIRRVMCEVPAYGPPRAVLTLRRPGRPAAAARGRDERHVRPAGHARGGAVHVEST